MKTLRIFATLFWLLCSAEYFIIAVVTPQSLNVEMRLGAARAMAYKPMLSGPRRRAINMVPTAEMTVERTKPQSRWKPPLAEIFAISVALDMW